MQIIQKALLDLPRDQYFIKHLDIINTFLTVELTPKEREVLGTFMSFTGETAEEDRFGPQYRKKVKRMLNQSDGGLSNHLRSLKEKGAIFEKDGVLEVLPILFPEEQQQFYQFKIVQR